MKVRPESEPPAREEAPVAYRLAWHAAECAGYLADLPVWLELAGPEPAEVLDLGSGSGRVATVLQRAGHRVTALDRDSALLTALAKDRPEIHRVVADARDFRIPRLFDLILAPMQLLQLFTEQADRRSCLAASLRHLAPGGRFACALVDLGSDQLPVGKDLLADGELSPDRHEIAPDLLATSTPCGFKLDSHRLLSITRRREIFTTDEAGEPIKRLHSTSSVQKLALLDADEMEVEFEGAGLRPLERRQVPATELHMGSVILVAEAA